MKTSDFIDNTLSKESLWNPYRLILDMEFTTVNETLYTVYKAAVSLAFVLFVLQLLFIIGKAVKTGESPLKLLIPTLIKLVIINVFMHPWTYRFMVVNIFVKPALAVSNHMTVKYVDTLQRSIRGVFEAVAGSAADMSSIISAVVDGSLFSSLFSAILFLVASVIIFVTTILQSALFTYMFFLGPIALSFAVLDFTASVTRAWISATLSIAWLGVFGSIVFICVNALALFPSLSSGIEDNNAIVVMVYGFMSLLTFVSILPIAFYFFDTSKSFKKMLSAQKTLGQSIKTGTAGVALGAAGAIASGFSAQGAGLIMDKLSGGKGRLGSAANMMNSYGSEAVKMGTKAYSNAFPASTINTKDVVNGLKNMVSSSQTPRQVK